MNPNEAQTRKSIIDQRLKEAGWAVGDPAQVVEEYVIPAVTGRVDEPVSVYRQKQQFSDYVLMGKDGKPLAVVEAKRTSKDSKAGREQAKQYCESIADHLDMEPPFCFYTNGHTIFYWDLGSYPPRKIAGFPSRQDLERLKFLKENRKPLAYELINTEIAGRDYQMQSIRQVMERLEKKHRKFLLVMATGTGKTRTAIALVDTLMRAGWIKRTLFLVDRIALREQALDAFKDHLPDEPRWPNLGEKLIDPGRRIYVSTYPSMLNIIQGETAELSPHFFDLIIIDESHRSIYNTYQGVLNYFDAIQLGLTATPTDIIDHNTFELFNCEDGLPTFAFTYEEAVQHTPPYLSDFEVLKLATRFQEEGINQRTISLEDQKKLLAEGREVEELDFEGSDLEKQVTNRGTNALIVKEFMEECIKDPNGVLPGKTIFFCISRAHARRMEEIFDALYPEYGGDLAKVIVSDDSRVHGKGGLLDQFKHKDMPRIAISVDMLDTGIDVREIVNLVFAKPVYSYTKFWQMIGRGTRLLEPSKVKAWCPRKDRFLIIDCWDNFEYFKLNPKGREHQPQVPLPVRYFGIRVDKLETALDLGETSIAEKETRKLQEQIEWLPTSSVIIQEAKESLAVVQSADFWRHLNAEKIELLRQHIKPLFRTLSQVDFKAMRFEKDTLEASLAFLRREQDKLDTLRDSLIETIRQLPLAVNTVALEAQLIERAQTNAYWAKIEDAHFDELAERLAPLMSYIETQRLQGGIVELNLRDVLTKKDTVEFGPEHEAVSVARYREMVEERIRTLTQQHPVLQKLMRGEEVADAEAESLAVYLNEAHPHITLDLLRRVYNNRKARFLQFIRHILGLEPLASFPDTVSHSIDQFIQEHSYLSGRQLEFLNLLREVLIDRGELEKRDLIQAPFTRLHPKGIRGVFSPKEIEEILQLTEKLVA